MATWASVTCAKATVGFMVVGLSSTPPIKRVVQFSPPSVENRPNAWTVVGGLLVGSYRVQTDTTWSELVGLTATEGLLSLLAWPLNGDEMSVCPSTVGAGRVAISVRGSSQSRASRCRCVFRRVRVARRREEVRA